MSKELQEGLLATNITHRIYVKSWRVRILKWRVFEERYLSIMLGIFLIASSVTIVPYIVDSTTVENPLRGTIIEDE